MRVHDYKSCSGEALSVSEISLHYFSLLIAQWTIHFSDRRKFPAVGCQLSFRRLAIVESVSVVEGVV